MTSDYSLTDEQRALAGATRALLDKHCDQEARRRYVAGHPHDPDLWHLMAGQLGLQGLLFPGALGGSGATLSDLLVVLEVTGAALLGGPFFASAAVSSLILAHTAQAGVHDDIVQAMASGKIIVTVAFAEADNEDGWTQPRVFAEQHGGWHISGRKVDVLAAAEADVALVTASIAGGDSGLFMVDLGADCDVQPSESIDPSRRMGTLQLRHAEATLIDCGPAHSQRMERALSAVLVAQAAETVGASAACLDATLGYLKIRHQFGQPIGSFQAIQHRCADLYVALVAAKAAATAAARDLLNSKSDHRVLASSALSLAVDNAVNVAEAAVQLHGAIGYTWEHDAHLFLRRALLSSRMWGDSSAHRRQAAQILWWPSADHDSEGED